MLLKVMEVKNIRVINVRLLFAILRYCQSRRRVTGSNQFIVIFAARYSRLTGIVVLTQIKEKKNGVKNAEKLSAVKVI